MKKDIVREKLEQLLEQSVDTLTTIIRDSEDEKTIIAAITQARGLMKDSGVDVMLEEGEISETLKNVLAMKGDDRTPFPVKRCK